MDDIKYIELNLVDVAQRKTLKNIEDTNVDWYLKKGRIFILENTKDKFASIVKSQSVVFYLINLYQKYIVQNRFMHDLIHTRNSRY